MKYILVILCVLNTSIAHAGIELVNTDNTITLDELARSELIISHKTQNIHIYKINPIGEAAHYGSKPEYLLVYPATDGVTEKSLGKRIPEKYQINPSLITNGKYMFNCNQHILAIFEVEYLVQDKGVVTEYLAVYSTDGWNNDAKVVIDISALRYDQCPG